MVHQRLQVVLIGHRLTNDDHARQNALGSPLRFLRAHAAPPPRKRTQRPDIAAPEGETRHAPSPHRGAHPRQHARLLLGVEM